jgi:predicted ATPase
LDQINRLLSNPECRLVTLIGPGGFGKSRLALRFAAVHFSFYGREEPLKQLLNFLREKEILLVLDYFEHLLAGADLLVEIRDNAPAIKFLVTSQERLNLQEEWLLEPIRARRRRPICTCGITRSI